MAGPRGAARVGGRAAVCALVGGLGLAGRPGLSAQEAEPGARDPSGVDTAAIPLPSLRVTVLRTPLPLARVPHAVTVERGADRAGPGLSLGEVLGPVPGLQVDNRYNFSQGDRIALRGFGARSQFGVRGVKVLVDGIPATLPDGQTTLSHVDPWTVGRAEVVRGPASAMHGNAAGGVIQLETRASPGDGRRLEAVTQVGAHGLRHHRVSAGWADGGASAGPTGGGAGASIGVLEYGGFREHASASKTFGAVRAGWRRGGTELRAVASAVSYRASNPGSLTAELLERDREAAHPYNVEQRAGERADEARVGVRWRQRPGGDAAAGSGDPGAAGAGGPELELSAWGLGRRLENPIPPAIIDLRRAAAGLRVAVRGSRVRAGPRIDWLAGVEAQGQWDDRTNHENVAGERGARVLDQAERVRSVAPFLEVGWRPAGPVHVLAGLRYDRYRFAVEDRLVADGDPDDSGVRRMAHASPSIGVVVERGGGSVYANVASSFETPTTTELVNRPAGGGGLHPGLDPQRAWTVEAGWRARVGDRVLLHGAAFRTAIRDALIPFEVPDSPGRSYFRNAGEATHRGLELDGWILLAPAARLRLGYAWLDARLDRFVTESGDRSGNRVPGVSPHRLRVALGWRPRAGLRAELTGRYADAVPVDDANTAAAPAYGLVDLRLGLPLEVGTAALELLAGMDNVLDREYVASVVVNAFGGRYYEPGPGRTVQLGLRAAFGGR